MQRPHTVDGDPTPKHVKLQYLETNFHRFQKSFTMNKDLRLRHPCSNILNVNSRWPPFQTLPCKIWTLQSPYTVHRSSNASEFILNPWITGHRESKDLVTWSQTQTSNSPRVKLQNRNPQMIKDFTVRLWNPKWFQWDFWDTNWSVTDPTHQADSPKHLTFKTWQTQHSLFLSPYFNLLLISFLGFEVGPTVILCRV